MSMYKKRPCDKTIKQDKNAWSKDDLLDEIHDRYGQKGYLKFSKKILCESLIQNKDPKEYIKISKKTNKDDYESLTVIELKEILREKGLKLSGKKSELISRLKKSRSSNNENENEIENELLKNILNNIKDINNLFYIASKLSIKISKNKNSLIQKIIDKYLKQNNNPKIDLNEIPKKYQYIFIYLNSCSIDDLMKISNLLDINIKKTNKTIIYILHILNYIRKYKNVDLHEFNLLTNDEDEIQSENVEESDNDEENEIEEEIEIEFNEEDKKEQKFLEQKVSNTELLTIASKYDINLAMDKDEILQNIFIKYKTFLNEMKENEKTIRENPKIKLKYIDDDYKLIYIYLKMCSHKELKNISKHLNLKIYKRDILIILNILTYIKDNGIKISIEDLEALQDNQTKIINDEKQEETELKCIRKSKIPLTEYQKNAVKYLLNPKNRSLLLYFETGTGKTLTAVTITQCLLKQNPKEKILVITPKSLQDNFKKEIEKYGGKRDDDRYEYYTFDEILHKYKNNDNPDFAKNKILIIDEAHKLRTKIGKKTGIKADLIINGAKKAKKVLLMTATPFYNKISDGINLLNLLKIENIKKLSDDEIISELSKYTIYQGKMNDPDFPAYEEHDVLINMNDEYYEQYKLVETDQSADIKSPWVFLNGVRRAMNKINEVPSQKIEISHDLVSKAIKENKKTLLFTNWLNVGVKLLYESLSDISKIKIESISGTTSKIKRQKIVDDFNKKKINTLIISSAGGEGLDLKEVEVVIMLDALWSEAAIQQVFGRAIRKKSHINLPLERQKVNIYYLYMVKPESKYQYEEKPSADVMMRDFVREKTLKLDNAYTQLQTLTIHNGISMPQVRLSVESIPFSNDKDKGSLNIKRSSHTLALYNSRRNLIL